MLLVLLTKLGLGACVLGLDVAQVLVEQLECGLVLCDLRQVRLQAGLDRLEMSRKRSGPKQDGAQRKVRGRLTFQSSFSARMLAASVRSRSAVPSASIRLSSA